LYVLPHQTEQQLDKYWIGNLHIMRVVARQTLTRRVSIARTPLPYTLRDLIAATHSIGRHSKTSIRTKSFVKTQIATMSSKSTQSQACCNTPAVISKGYSPKGDYIQVDGLKTCTTTPSNPHMHMLIPSPRRHRPQRRKARHSRRLRYLRLLQPNAARRRHPRPHRHRSPVSGLHA
jgi:hypothetical protein